MFKCEMCGECCKHLDKSYLYQELDRGDGVCKFLKDNICSIYKDRPLSCRVDESYEAFFSKTYDKETYYRLNKEVCKLLQNKEEVK